MTGLHLRWQLRVLITASRHMTRRDVVDMWMLRMIRRANHEGVSGKQILWVLGDCPTGGDLFAWDWLKANRMFFRRYEADWDRYGPTMGGPIRNNLMISEARPTHTLAFLCPKSRGAVGCSDRAQSISEVTRIYSPSMWKVFPAGTDVPPRFDWSLVDETL